MKYSRRCRKDRTLYIGILLIITASVAYSTAGLFVKGVEAGPWEIVFWRGVFAAGFTALWTVRNGQFRQNFYGIGVSGWAVAIIGALGSAAFIPAFKLMSVANVSLIYAAAPLVAAVLALVFIREQISFRTALGCLGAMLGVAIIVSGSTGEGTLQGDVLAMCMTLAMAIIMVIYRAVPTTPGAGPTAYQSILLIPIAALLGQPFSLDPVEFGLLSSFGLLFTIASVALAEGAKRVPSGQAALLSALETPLAPVFAFFVLSEIPTGKTIVGGAIVLVAVLSSIKLYRT